MRQAGWEVTVDYELKETTVRMMPKPYENEPAPQEESAENKRPDER